MPPDGAYVELVFKPNVELVTVVRKFVQQFYDRMLPDRVTTSSLALVTHELLENAVKYSTDGETKIRIDLVPQDGQFLLTIMTRNNATPEDRTEVMRILTEMREAADSFRFYQELIQKASKRRGGSGLGLARIRAEADMQLDANVEGQEIVLIARTQVPAQKGE